MAAFMSGLLFLFVLVGSSYALSGADINTICGKALNQPFCQNFLKTNPKIPAASLPAAAQITIDAAYDTASQTRAKIVSLLKTEAEPKTKAAYTTCLEKYESSIGDLDEAKKALAEGDAATVNIKVSAAMDEPKACIEDLKNVKADPSVAKNSETVFNVCGITLVISNMLPKRM